MKIRLSGTKEIIEVPDNATKQQIDAYVNYRMGAAKKTYTPEENLSRAIAQEEAKPEGERDMGVLNTLRSMATADPVEAARLARQGKIETYKKLYPEDATGAFATLMPRAFESAAAGDNLLKTSIAGALDAGSIPGRAIASSVDVATGAPSFGESMRDTEGGNIAGKVVRDPATFLLAPVGGSAGLSVLKQAAGKGTVPLLKTLANLSAIGAATGASAGVLGEAEDYRTGEGFSPGDVAGSAAVGAVLGPIMPAIVSGTGAVGQKMKQLLAGMGRVSTEYLDILGTRGLKKVLLGKDDPVLDMLDNLSLDPVDNIHTVYRGVDDFARSLTPIYKEAEKATESMGEINLKPTIDALHQMKKVPDGMEGLFPEGVPAGKFPGRENADINAFNAKIDDLVAILEGGERETMGSVVIPAKRVLQKRQRIDEVINFNRDKYGTAFAENLDALAKKTRTMLRGQLIDAAEKTNNPQYIESMARYTDGKTILEGIEKQLGYRANMPMAKITDDVLIKTDKFLKDIAKESPLARGSQLANQYRGMSGVDLKDFARDIQLSRMRTGTEDLSTLLETTGRSMLPGQSLGAGSYANPLANILATTAGQSMRLPSVAAPLSSITSGVFNAASNVALNPFAKAAFLGQSAPLSQILTGGQ